MGKLLDRLEKQLKTDNVDHKTDAIHCLKIYNKLKEISDGKVWESDWNPLTKVEHIGQYPNNTRIYKPNQLGYIFLKGIE